MRELLRSIVRPAFRHAPALRRAGLKAIDVLLAPVLFGFTLRHSAPADVAPDKGDAEVEAFNRAAEDYFAKRGSDGHLLRKPFSEPESLSRRLIDLGVLIDGLRLTPGMTVMELGAGSCWVSHFLNRMGCRTLAVDVSPSALALGRTMFEQDPATDWSLQPLFLAYDGRRLPTGDGTVDAVVVYDAFHHLPNPQHLLRELRRVLKADGIVGMSEPGRGHAASEPSQAEAADSGVLEDELIVERIAEMAGAAGFSATKRIVASNRPLLEIDAARTGQFMGGRGFAQYWDALCSALESHYFLLFYKGTPEPTTARPKHLKAYLTSATARVEATADRETTVGVRVQNVGDTRWLAAEGAGWTRVGGHLYSAAPPRQCLAYDWFRCALPGDLAPGEKVSLRVTLPPLPPGQYEVVIDLVIEGVVWFADRESAALTIPVSVAAATGSAE